MEDHHRIRAWSKQKNGKGEEYLRCHHLHEIHSVGHGLILTEWAEFKNNDPLSEITLTAKSFLPLGAVKEHCTGLKDKTGKLIFEGDILYLTKDSSNQIQKCELVCKVIFNLSSFCAEVLKTIKWEKFNSENNDGGTYFFNQLSFCFDEVSIIGNVHENQELLK